MTWSYNLDGHWTVKAAKEYPWPCAMAPHRTFELMPGDVLTKGANGTMTKHNGLCMTNLRVPEDDLVHVERSIEMVVGNIRDA